MEVAVLNSLHSVTANSMQEVVSHFAQIVAMVHVRCHGFFCLLQACVNTMAGNVHHY